MCVRLLVWNNIVDWNGEVWYIVAGVGDRWATINGVSRNFKKAKGHEALGSIAVEPSATSSSIKYYKQPLNCVTVTVKCVWELHLISLYGVTVGERDLDEPL